MQETGTWPATREEARTQGASKFFDGSPCRRGHAAPKHTTGGCAVCKAVSKRAGQDRRKQDYRDKTARWKLANPDRWQAYSAAYQDSARHAPRPRPAECEVCKQAPSRTLHFDHDHETGAFRGWLCHGCNVALGLTKDNPATLRALADYLERGPKDVAPLAA